MGARLSVETGLVGFDLAMRAVDRPMERTATIKTLTGKAGHGPGMQAVGLINAARRAAHKGNRAGRLLARRA